MKDLKYTHSLVSYSALLILHMLKGETKEMEALWTEMINEKFEPSWALKIHRLAYYCRYTDDLEASRRVYDEIVKYARPV